MALERGARGQWAAFYPDAFGLSQLPVALAPSGDVWGAESKCWVPVPFHLRFPTFSPVFMRGEA